MQGERMGPRDSDYYKRRILAEDRLAAQAGSPKVAAIHRLLSSHYKARLTGRVAEPSANFIRGCSKNNAE